MKNAILIVIICFSLNLNAQNLNFSGIVQSKSTKSSYDSEWKKPVKLDSSFKIKDNKIKIEDDRMIKLSIVSQVESIVKGKKIITAKAIDDNGINCVIMIDSTSFPSLVLFLFYPDISYAYKLYAEE